MRDRVQETPCPGPQSAEGCAFPVVPSTNDAETRKQQSATTAQGVSVMKDFPLQYLILEALLDALVVPSQLCTL